MKYLKLYENFSVGKTVYLILSKDRTKQLSLHYGSQYMCGFHMDELGSDTRLDDLRDHDTEEKALGYLSQLRKKVANNYYTERIDDNYITKTTLYPTESEFKEVIKKYKGKSMPITKARVGEFFPGLDNGYRQWINTLRWGVGERPYKSYNMGGYKIDADVVSKYPNQENHKDFINFLSSRDYEKISFEDYLSVLDQFEVVPFFIGGYEQEDLNI